MTKQYSMTQLAEREISAEDACVILDQGEYAVLSMVDEDGAPYGIPVSYAMIDNKMYIHTGLGPGHKFDNWQRDNRISVAIAIDIEPLYMDTFFTTRYASVVASGTIMRVEDPVVIRKALVALCMKYVPEAKAEIGGAIERELDMASVWEITFDEVRAKAGRWKRKG